jgi:osmotically-inducible protein OsmY
MRGAESRTEAPIQVMHSGHADRQTAQRVMQELWASNMPGLRRIAIEVRRETVILRGEVGSFHERQTAIARTAQVSGVSRVVDMLRVRAE